MKLSTGVSKRDEKLCPAAAVPVIAKIPEPMIAPMPMQVRSKAPRVRFICRSGAAASRINESGLFVLKSCDATFSPWLRFAGANRGIATRRGSILSFDIVPWREISSKNAMPVFSGANLIGGLLFGSIGFVAFVYGKRMHVWQPMFLGLALMAYPSFVR